jgi:hypothetical protein
MPVMKGIREEERSMDDAARIGARLEASAWVLRGAVMGIAAGGVFLLFEIVAAGIMSHSSFVPLRMIAAVALGEGALPGQPTIGLAVVVPAALAVHYALSALYGAAFGAIIGMGGLHNNRLVLVGAAAVFGFLLWLVNFYAIAPLAFPWFSMTNPLVQIAAHAFFGTALGLSLAWWFGGSGK